MTLFRIYYSELTEFEDYVEASTKEQAVELFKNSLECELIEPIACTVNEFEVEATVSHI